MLCDKVFFETPCSIPVAHDGADVVGDCTVDAVDTKTSQQHQPVEAGELLVLFGIFQRLGRIGVVPTPPFVLVLREIVEQRSKLVGKLVGQKRHCLLYTSPSPRDS